MQSPPPFRDSYPRSLLPLQDSNLRSLLLSQNSNRFQILFYVVIARFSQAVNLQLPPFATIQFYVLNILYNKSCMCIPSFLKIEMNMVTFLIQIPINESTLPFFIIRFWYVFSIQNTCMDFRNFEDIILRTFARPKYTHMTYTYKIQYSRET